MGRFGTCQACGRSNRLLKKVTIRLNYNLDDPELDDVDICVDEKSCRKETQKEIPDAGV